MEIIAKISKGSRMDQVYIPKNRTGFSIGSYVILKPIKIKKPEEKLFFYGIKEIEPIKLELIREVVKIINNEIENYDNILATGSFLEKGFNFNDIDVMIMTNSKINENLIKKKVENVTKINTHLIVIDSKSLIKGLSIDPLFQVMLSKCVSKKRLVPLPLRNLRYKYLDAQLIRSKIIGDEFNYLSGKEKYKLTRNMVAIHLFIKNKNLTNEDVEKEIERKFNVKVEDIKNNSIFDDFRKKYKKFYIKLEKEVIENAAKQEKAT